MLKIWRDYWKIWKFESYRNVSYYLNVSGKHIMDFIDLLMNKVENDQKIMINPMESLHGSPLHV